MKSIKRMKEQKNTDFHTGFSSSKELNKDESSVAPAATSFSLVQSSLLNFSLPRFTIAKYLAPDAFLPPRRRSSSTTLPGRFSASTLVRTQKSNCAEL
jgi:hypothetical protein